MKTIVMADSDIAWAPDCLKTVVSELSQDGVGLVTCPYRAISGSSMWSRVEALGLNVDFISGMLTARMLNGMDYAIGCTIATRREDIEAIGGPQGGAILPFGRLCHRQPHAWHSRTYGDPVALRH